ncbi:MAG: LAGLIDADG family homing endonuclease [Candidatus Andersenbacteria bacterium]
MPARWTLAEEKKLYRGLHFLYVKKNKTIGEIAHILNLDPTSVYDRLVRLNIPRSRASKTRYNNQRTDVGIPTTYSPELAEFIGILLGDGHLTSTQVTVTLGKKEKRYAEYVADLIKSIFRIYPAIIKNLDGDLTVYFGSTAVVRWFLEMGLVHNKVRSQVDVPAWCFSKRTFIRSVLRGLIDTDGSVYTLRHGVQISFCNRSYPLLKSARLMMQQLGLRPSKISCYKVYLTRQKDLGNYLRQVGFSNRKHLKRLLVFSQLHGQVLEAAKPDRL